MSSRVAYAPRQAVDIPSQSSLDGASQKEGNNHAYDVLRALWPPARRGEAVRGPEPARDDLAARNSPAERRALLGDAVIVAIHRDVDASLAEYGIPAKALAELRGIFVPVIRRLSGE